MKVLSNDSRINLFSFKIKSPQELKSNLVHVNSDLNKNLTFAELSIYGPGILVRQFELPHLKLSEISDALRLEASEVFSIPHKEISLSYQIMGDFTEKIKGIYVALPKKTVKEYLSCFEAVKIIPIKLTAEIIKLTSSFLYENNSLKSNFCILESSVPSIMNLAVFFDGNLELLREIEYEDWFDAQRKATESLKYLSGRKSHNRLEAIYYLGDLSGKQEFISSLEDSIEFQDTKESVSGIQEYNKYIGLLSKINLFKEFELALTMRNIILKILRIIIVCLMVLSLVLIMKIFIKSIKISKLRSSFSASDYNYARELKEKLIKNKIVIE